MLPVANTTSLHQQVIEIALYGVFFLLHGKYKGPWYSVSTGEYNFTIMMRRQPVTFLMYIYK